MKLYLALLGLLVTEALPSAKGCEPQWDNFADTCYYAYLEKVYTYDEAKSICRGKGGELVTIDDSHKNLFLKGYTMISGKQNLWIGLSDIENEADWRWEDGTELSYRNWATREPRRPGRLDCAVISGAKDGYWETSDCAEKLGFICKKSGPCNSEPVGVENRVIPNSQMTASSNYNSKHMSHQGRLNYHGPSGYSHSWCALHNNAAQWLQVDLGGDRKVTKVATQGRSDYSQWVTSFKLGYHKEHGQWTYVTRDDGSEKIFIANSDRNTIVYHELGDKAFTAESVRFYPVTWYGHISMRVEIYACQ